MLDLINIIIYVVPISNGGAGKWTGQCDDTGKIINAKGLGKNKKIILSRLIDEGASLSPIRIVARDNKKVKGEFTSLRG